MAPFTISPPHPLLYQCALPQEALLMQSKKSLSDSPGASEGLPLTRSLRASIVKIRAHLWRVVQRVMNFCMSVTELLGSKMFFMSLGKNMAMTGELKKNKSGAEALQRPGCEMSATEMKDPAMKVIMELDGDESAADEWDSAVMDEEEDDEARLSEWESDEETYEEEEGREPQDEDSEWSDEDDEDSEASAESLELWESFFNRVDPYNPLSFCSSISSRTNTKHRQQTPPPEEREPESEPDSKERTKKVCFSDEVSVRPLVAWRFASRAARDGSCWMQMARDRERFRRRAESFETLLKPFLSARHRAGVWHRLQTNTS